MSAAAGASYRHRLELVADGGIEPYLDAWATRQSIERTGPWRRVYGKLRPQRSPWALLVYEAPGVPTLQVRLLESADGSTVGLPGGAAAAGALGRVEIGACADDPALPGIAAVLAALDEPRVARYHPGNRCTVHGRSGAAARFVKVFSDEVDDQREAAERWAAAASGILSFAVAEPHGWDEPTRSSWYGVVPGGPLVQQLWDREGVRLAHRVGSSLGELAVAPFTPGRTDDAAGQLARTRRALSRASAAAPGLTSELNLAFDALTRAHARLGPRPLVPIHGAAHLGQWLVEGSGRLGIIDFDRFARGEPEFDLATFIVELRAELGQPPRADLEEAVIDGFCGVAGRLDRRLLQVYLLHKQLARAARTAAGLSPDGEQRAARLLEELQDPLRSLSRV